MRGPTGSARAFQISISQCFLTSDILRIARILMARHARSPRSLRASAGLDADLQEQERWGRQTRQNTDGPVPLHRNSGQEVRLRRPEGSDQMTVATRAETATRTRF